jgi:hypothetical protein
MTATSHGVNSTPILASCQCGDDPALQLLRDLMNNGMAQLEASKIAFGHDPGPQASRDTWSTWIKVEARKLGNAARRQLGLPELPLVEAVH